MWVVRGEMGWTRAFHNTGWLHIVYSGRVRSGSLEWLHRKIAGALVGYETVSDRVLVVRLNANPRNITLIQMCGSTIAATDFFGQEYSKKEHPSLRSDVARGRSVRQQVAKPQVLMTSTQNCSKQEERQDWAECTEYVWRSGKLVSGQRNGRSPRSPHSFHFPRKVSLISVKNTEQE